MEFLLDPSIWVGLLTLIILEIVLGIDNLVFIAILVKKLPPAQRDKARIIGLSLALLMRLGLLSVMSWLVTLTQPLFSFRSFTFSARDLIMLFGGFFLLFKATMELNERLEGKDSNNPTQRKGAKFWGVVAMGAGVVILAFLPWLDRSPVKSIRYRGPIFKTLLVFFVFSFLILGFLGTKPPEYAFFGVIPGAPVAQLMTLYYFLFFLTMPWWSKVDKCKPVPERVTFK